MRFVSSEGAKYTIAQTKVRVVCEPQVWVIMGNKRNKGMPEQQQQGQQDNSLDFLWMIAFLIGAIVLGWYFGKTYIASVILQVRFYEITAIDFLFSLFTKLTQFVGLPSPQSNLSALASYIQKNIGAAMDYSDLVNVSIVVGNYLKYPLTLLIVAGAALLHFSGVSHRFRHTFDTKLLKNLEQENWPQITPVVKLDLVNKKLDDGPWAISLSPMRFCKKNNMIDIEEKNGKYNVTLRRGVANRILSLQLGPRWFGAEVLPMHLKALAAIFAARINGDKKNADALLDQISASASSSHLNYSGVEELLRKNISSKKVGKIIGLHAYVTTVLASMLVGARELGVLATSEFIWLKPIDRRMWYMLNSTGRPTAVSEICGAFSHWLAEKKLGLPLAVPMIEEGVRGLELALSDMIYKPEEEE